MLTAFTEDLVVVIVGLAFLGLIGNGLAAALRDGGHRKTALMAFRVTLGEAVIAGAGLAFWGAVVCSFALFVQQYTRSQG